MPQELGLVHDLEPSDSVFALVHFQDCLYQIIDVTLRVDPAWNCQAQQFVMGFVGEHYRADFYRPYSGMTV